MRGLFAGLAICALALAGCQAGAPMTDPFAAARVPPPPIGSVSGPPAPYGATIPPAVSVPSGAPIGQPPVQYGAPAGPPPGAPIQGLAPPPAANQPYGTPGPIAPPAASNAPPSGGWYPAPTNTASAATPENSVYKNGEGPPLQSLTETSASGKLAHAATETPGGANVPGQQNLQPLTQLQQVPVAQPLRDPRGVTGGVQPVSYQAPMDDPNHVSHRAYAKDHAAQASAAGAQPYRPGSTAQSPGVSPTSAAKGPTDQGATYGFDGNYAWLHGQLEYSAATKVWKLRYVPIDGPTDRFGGSVVLADSDLLAGHKAGEFVAVKGQLDGRPGPQGSYSPLYRVSEVQRLSE
jgi:hypothetical protein